MPITYRIDGDSGILFVKMFGNILTSDIKEHWIDLAEDPSAAKTHRRLVDIREASFMIKGADIWRRVDEFYRKAVGERSIKVAIIAANDEQEVIFRKWAAVIPTNVKTKIFNDLNQAMEWLKDGQSMEIEQ
jgi:hypothetical protein